jgi:hypothetical protein
MKPVIIIAIALVFLIPTSVFAQESLLCPSGSYHGLDNTGNDACRDVKTNQIVESLPKPIPESKINSPSSPSEIITFSDDSTPLILLVGMVVIGVAGISAFKIIGKNNLNKQKEKEAQRKKDKEKQRIEREKEEKLIEKERYKKIQEEQQKRQKQEDKEANEAKEARQRIIDEQKRKYLEEKELDDKLKNELKEKEIKKELEFQEKIKNKETIYDSSVVESIQHIASLRIFYDLEKKSTKYWNETGLLDRIHFKDNEIKEELKITQNKITFRISVESGGKHKFAKLISGGSMDFWDHDTGGYNLQIHFSKPEEFLKAVMVKHIRASLSKVQIHDSEYSISAILVRQDADYDDASNILKRIIYHFCDEMLETGDILVEKK